MRIYAIQTGVVKIKSAQVEGRGHSAIARQLAIYADPVWTDWLPTYAWAIEHEDGVIVVDTGQGVHLLKSRQSYHPFLRWEVGFQMDRDEEIGPQLRKLGIGSRDVRKVVLTHLHMDHDGGIAHFPDSEIVVAAGELRTASGWAGRIRGYLPNRWPSWFDPSPLALMDGPFGPFARSGRLTRSGDVIAVATPGHTADHISVVVQEDDGAVFLAGDTSYNESLMLAGKVDGVSTTEQTSKATLDAIRHFTQVQPTTYLPTHDPQSALRLRNRCRVEQTGPIASLHANVRVA
jgi:glyoxylase-like metal-dependent hydrolase (beta-lactamase superfamily II)